MGQGSPSKLTENKRRTGNIKQQNVVQCRTQSYDVSQADGVVFYNIEFLIPQESVAVSPGGGEMDAVKHSSDGLTTSPTAATSLSDRHPATTTTTTTTAGTSTAEDRSGPGEGKTPSVEDEIGGDKGIAISRTSSSSSDHVVGLAQQAPSFQVQGSTSPSSCLGGLSHLCGASSSNSTSIHNKSENSASVSIARKRSEHGKKNEESDLQSPSKKSDNADGHGSDILQNRCLTWRVQRRFRDFDRLHSSLCYHYDEEFLPGGESIPQLPSKIWFTKSVDNLDLRRAKLQVYLNAMLRLDCARRSTSLGGGGHFLPRTKILRDFCDIPIHIAMRASSSTHAVHDGIRGGAGEDSTSSRSVPFGEYLPSQRVTDNTELLAYIFTFLPPRVIAGVLPMVCSAFYLGAHSSQIWKKLKVLNFDRTDLKIVEPIFSKEGRRF